MRSILLGVSFALCLAACAGTADPANQLPSIRPVEGYWDVVIYSGRMPECRYRQIGVVASTRMYNWRSTLRRQAHFQKADGVMNITENPEGGMSGVSIVCIDPDTVG